MSSSIKDITREEKSLKERKRDFYFIAYYVSIFTSEIFNMVNPSSTYFYFLDRNHNHSKRTQESELSYGVYEGVLMKQT